MHDLDELTPRDIFAAVALGGLLASRGERVLATPDLYADIAYRMADAMAKRATAEPVTLPEIPPAPAVS